ncbi:SigE family RNA polymerase sigma factor [Catellatospora vulcania]|uniref:SigE family RNA polymerase sigma factor n=1 Tax=Catellatospora vulcania TaxID=1460450 RepID=UPI002E7BC386|nr:SigE family RNA polymerase sigma factor [Catellatospora vulcania]
MHPEFEDYVRARSGPLVGFAYLLCRDRHLAEDLVQEVLAKAYRRWDRIEADNPDAYLRKAVVWAHSSWWRRLSHRERPLETAPDAAGDDDFVQRHAVRDELWALLGTLPRRQRTVLVLRFFEDLDDERIAELMDCSPATVRVHAHRGLAALRSRLANPVPVPAGERSFPAVPVESVRRRAVGVRRRRQAGLAAAVAAVIVALIMLVPGWRGTQPPPVTTPTPTSPATPSPSAAAPSVLVPVGSGGELPSFAYEPGWLPDKVGPLEVVSSLDMTGLESTGRPGYLLVYAAPTPYRWDWEAEQTRTVQVNGVSATLRTGDYETGPAVGLTWRRDSRWLTVQSFGGLLTVAEVERFARELRPGRLTASPRIRYSLAPAGYELDSLGVDHLCLSREPRLRPEDPVGVCINIGTDTSMVGPERSLLVGGRPARLERGDPGAPPTTLWVRLDEQRVLSVTQDAGDLDETDLIRFAESITVAGPAGQ